MSLLLGCDSRMAGNDPPFDAVRANRAAGAGSWLPQPGVTHARPPRPGMGGARNVRTSARMRKSRPVRRVFAESARSGSAPDLALQNMSQMQRLEKIPIRHIRTTPLLLPSLATYGNGRAWRTNRSTESDAVMFRGAESGLIRLIRSV